MHIQLLFTLFIATNFISGIHSLGFAITNNCPFSIAPITTTTMGVGPDISAIIPPKTTNAFSVGTPWIGQLWGRYGCSIVGENIECKSGECDDPDDLNCSHHAPPVTLIDFNLTDEGSRDTYRINLVEGFNLHVTVFPQGNSTCQMIDCGIDINRLCLPELAQKDESGKTIGCKSACVAFNQTEYCCNGDHNTQKTCPPTKYSKFFKDLCPMAYTYPYDGKTSTFSCEKGADYLIVFCRNIPST